MTWKTIPPSVGTWPKGCRVKSRQCSCNSNKCSRNAGQGSRSGIRIRDSAGSTFVIFPPLRFNASTPPLAISGAFSRIPASNVDRRLGAYVRQSCSGCDFLSPESTHSHTIPPEAVVRIFGHEKDIVFPCCQLDQRRFSPAAFHRQRRPGPMVLAWTNPGRV